jgi:hypothetical protein
VHGFYTRNAHSKPYLLCRDADADSKEPVARRAALTALPLVGGTLCWRRKMPALTLHDAFRTIGPRYRVANPSARMR